MKNLNEVKSPSDLRAFVKDGVLPCGYQFSHVRKFLLSAAHFREHLLLQGASEADINKALLTQGIIVEYMACHGKVRTTRYLAD